MITFPKKRISVGGMITDAEGNLLIVKPGYRDGWLLPGGVVDANESPAAALDREIAEELGIRVPIKSLVCVDYTLPCAQYEEGIHMLFDCGQISAGQQSSLHLCDRELTDLKFCSREEAMQLLVETIAKRMRRIKFGQVVYLENGTDLI